MVVLFAGGSETVHSPLGSLQGNVQLGYTGTEVEEVEEEEGGVRRTSRSAGEQQAAVLLLLLSLGLLGD